MRYATFGTSSATKKCVIFPVKDKFWHTDSVDPDQTALRGAV